MSNDYFIPRPIDPFLNLERPIIFFDLETTGTDVANDRIVEICAIKVFPDGRQEELHELVNPGCPIPPSATAIHRITDEQVRNKPSFEQQAQSWATWFQSCDLGGYNIRRFDVPMLMEAFRRCGYYPINFNEVKFVDAMAIYHALEKRDLSAAVRFYCNREHDGAHSAKADVLATIDILKQQLIRYADISPDTASLHEYGDNGITVDISRRFIRNEKGDIVFNFGKHHNKLACEELGYLQWMIKGDFPADTKMVAKRIYMHCTWEKEIKDWLEEKGIWNDPSLAFALYATVKYMRPVHPFTISIEESKPIIGYNCEQPVIWQLPHPDAVGILLQLIETYTKVVEGSHKWQAVQDVE